MAVAQAGAGSRAQFYLLLQRAAIHVARCILRGLQWQVLAQGAVCSGAVAGTGDGVLSRGAAT